MIVTIDGPAGSGKSTTAREVARRLGFRHLDSGAFYRALTWAALQAGVPPEDWDSLSMQELAGLGVRAETAAEGFHMRVGGRVVTEELRSAEVNAHVSRMARVPTVRLWLLEQLRSAARGQDLVTDGRDMGTVVFPDADLKVFLTAALDTRARRRLAQQGDAQPQEAEVAAEIERIARRDRIDSERDIAPLRRPAGAVDLDTTALTFDEQVACIVSLARGRVQPG